MQSDDLLNALGPPHASNSSAPSTSLSYDLPGVFRTLSDVKDEALDHHVPHPPHPLLPPFSAPHHDFAIKSEASPSNSHLYSVADYSSPAASLPATLSSILTPPSSALPPIRGSSSNPPLYLPPPSAPPSAPPTASSTASSSASFLTPMPVCMSQGQSLHGAPGLPSYAPQQHPMPLPAHQQHQQHQHHLHQHQSQHQSQQHSTSYPLPPYFNDSSQPFISTSQQYGASGTSSAAPVPAHFSNNTCPPWYQTPDLEPVSRPYKPCVVCNDRSSGYHYGVSSCEGCKGFFRRSVQKNLQYVCNKDKSCIINKVTRNRCQYCRLNKCFSMGMSREAVRNDRNRKKKDSLSSLEGADQQASSTSEIVELTAEDTTLLASIREAHQSTFPMPDQVEVVDEVREEERLGLWDKIEELSLQGVKRIVNFAKRLPDFQEMRQNDQALLLRSAIMELVLLRMSSRYDTESDSVLFSSGLRLTRCALQALGFDDITDSVVLFAQKMANLQVDEVEYAILSSVCLCSGDRSGLEEPRSVDRIQERILDLFRRYVRKTYPDQPRRFAKLLMKLTDLRGISVKGGDRIFHFIKKKSEGEMPPLVVELLNRDENVCIP